MKWISLTSENQLSDLIERSSLHPQVIFKHSTRCSVSSMVKSRLENSPVPENIDFYCLNLLQNRPLSAKIAETFSVTHESPQVLLISKGECLYEESHWAISMEDILENI